MTESPGVLFERLLDVMMRLRAPDGCPWDRVQTRTSLKPYLIEEAYEVLEAIESGRSAPLQEELGDLLFQVVFHARLAEELGEFTTADLLRQLIDKMVRRHPHVFGDASVGTATEALAQWEAIKQREADERGQRRSILDGGPRELRLARRACGVDQGRGGGPRGLGGARLRRRPPHSRGARRRALFARERGASRDARRRRGAARRDREVSPTLHRHGGGARRARYVGLRGSARRTRARVERSESRGAQREAAMRLRIGQSSVAIERGDITDWEVDAIVNAANATLAMGTGVAGAIKRKGGVIIEEEAMRQGPVEVGEAVLTTGGNLAATHVIHAAVMGPDLKTDGDRIAATTRAVLGLATKHRITSLALPALGTGVGHVPPAVSGEAMLNAVIGHLKAGGTSLKRVTFVLYQDDAYKAFTDTLKR